ncbi:MAG: hypothetical protein K5928_04870 [Prevotella sp.]|nr:hypothetical protein [Prevotella sp.]
MKKSLLFAAALLTCGMAGAQTVYFSQDYEAEGATPDWTSSVGGRFTPTIFEKEGNHYLGVNQEERNNNGCVLTSTSLQGKVEAGANFTMTFDVKIGSSNNQSPVEFSIYDAENKNKMLHLTATGTYATDYTINDNSSDKVTISEGGGKGIDDLMWKSVTLSRKEGLTYLTVSNKETGTVIYEQNLVATLSEAGGLGKMEFITKRYNANFAIDNVVVRELADGDVPQAAATSYTIKYQDEQGNKLKDDVVVNTVVGTTISITADQIAPFYTGEGDEQQKWLFKNQTPGEDIVAAEEASDNVFVLTFRKAGVYNYSVTVDAGMGSTIYTDKGFEQDEVYAAYPLYVNVGGTLWTKAATNKEYRQVFTLTQDNQELAITGYENTEIGGVVYYAEAENLEGLTAAVNGNTTIRSSNAGSAYNAGEENFKLTTLPAGQYKIYAVACAVRAYSEGFKFLAGDNDILNIDTSTANNWLAANATFTLTGESDIFMAPGGNTNAAIDFVYIQDTTVTGIESVKNETAGAAIYNLAGQRVVKTQKGLYIQNGKKYMVK